LNNGLGIVDTGGRTGKHDPGGKAVKYVKTAFKYLAIIIIFDIIAGTLMLTVADYSGKTPIYYKGIRPGFFGRMKESVKDYVGWPDLGNLRGDIRNTFKKITYKKPNVVKGRSQVAQNPVAMEGTLLLNGFDFRYRDNAHRLSLMEASVDGITYDAGSGNISGMANAALEGGDWSRVDGMNYEMSYRPLVSRKAGFSHGSESLLLEGGRSKVNVKIDLEPLGLAAYSNVSVALRGFILDTGEEYPDGFNIKGIAVWLNTVSRTGRFLEMDVTVELKAGEVAFRPDPGYYYTTRAQVLYTLIGTDEGSFTRVGHHYMLLNREHAPQRVRKVYASVGLGPGIVIPAFQGFEFDIHTTKARYLRNISLSLAEPQFDALTGNASVLCNGYLSNEGTLSGALDVRFAADLLFIKLPEASSAKPVVVKGTITDVTETSSVEIEAKL
jgi:hypothetical protein